MSGKKTTVKSMDVGYHISQTIIYNVYSLSVLGMGIWGYTTVPITSSNLTLQMYLRALLILGAIMLTISIGRGLCVLNCYKNVPTPADTPELLDRTVIVQSVETPDYLLQLNLVTSIAAIAIYGGIITKANSDPALKDPSYSNFKSALNVAITLPVIAFVVYGSMIYFRGSKKDEKRRREKEREIEMISFSQQNPSIILKESF